GRCGGAAAPRVVTGVRSAAHQRTGASAPPLRQSVVVGAAPLDDADQRCHHDGDAGDDQARARQQRERAPVVAHMLQHRCQRWRKGGRARARPPSRAEFGTYLPDRRRRAPMARKPRPEARSAPPRPKGRSAPVDGTFTVVTAATPLVVVATGVAVGTGVGVAVGTGVGVAVGSGVAVGTAWATVTSSHALWPFHETSKA